MANIETILGVGTEPEKDTGYPQALARQLRGQQDLGGYLSLSPIQQIGDKGREITAQAFDTALATGKKRQRLVKAQALKEQQLVTAQEDTRQFNVKEKRLSAEALKSGRTRKGGGGYGGVNRTIKPDAFGNQVEWYLNPDTQQYDKFFMDGNPYDRTVAKKRGAELQQFEQAGAGGKAFEKGMGGMDANTLKDATENIPMYDKISDQYQSAINVAEDAMTGPFDQWFPDFRESTMLLANLQDSLALGMLNEYNLKPISDTDLKVLKNVAIPMNIQQEDLVPWLEHKRDSYALMKRIQTAFLAAGREDRESLKTGSPQHTALQKRLKDIRGDFDFAYNPNKAQADKAADTAPRWLLGQPGGAASWANLSKEQKAQVLAK